MVAALELLGMTGEDVNSMADLLYRSAVVTLSDVLLIHYSYATYYYSIVCSTKWDH